MPHKPLSNWTIAVHRPETGTARWDPSADVNDGDDRADARLLPEFGAGWLRRRVTLDISPGVLGLVHQESGRIVVELDEMAQPIEVSEAGLAIIDRIEAQWPEAVLDAAELEALGNERIPLRHLLVRRLAEEGDPPAELFHVLPWDLVSRLAEEVIAALQGTTPGTPIWLRHWFTPAGSRFTAALEQLAAGQRAADATVARLGATALCARLPRLEISRVPRVARLGLSRLMDVLASGDPFLAYSARLASQHLTGDDHAGARNGHLVRLTSTLRPAAATDRRIRRHSEQLHRDPFTIDLHVTDTGRLEIDVAATLTPDLAATVSRTYHVMVLPVDVRGTDGDFSYFIPLQVTSDGLVGFASLPMPSGEFEVTFDDPPIGLAEVKFLHADDLRSSVRTVRTNRALRPWRELAARLPADHPLHGLLAALTGETR
ncbi:hypothetical protein GCM10009555_024060 [Acrocarpospora macrocephala]|uniref:Uncharacterized protein n=1 Tax=Acrocarpospora macrocephala TaxID=150177 RepID=A0A5M3X202_9ACTN|nr:hypothetical protein [Acrocarpospora macrocephala]GES12338.1 hypothetical protein Amac_059350 [Acrocarpospora macrocephala]